MPPPRDVIVTERLSLVPSGPEFAEEGHRIVSEPDVSRTLSRAPWPPDPEFTRKWFARHLTEWEEERAYRFAVTQAGRMIGLVDLEVIGDAAELGYWVETASQGKGLTLEAAAAAVAFGLDTCGFDRIEATHAVGNTASVKLLTRLGFEQVSGMPMRPTYAITKG